MVVVVVVVELVVTPTHGSGSHAPSPRSNPPQLVHSAGLRVSHENAPAGDDTRQVEPAGTQHWMSCGACAFEHPSAAASQRLAYGVTQALPPRGAVQSVAAMMPHLVVP